MLFCIMVLPLELTSAPFIFTKVMRCLLKHWRINAIRIAYFLDDGLGVASSYKMILFGNPDNVSLWEITKNL